MQSKCALYIEAISSCGFLLHFTLEVPMESSTNQIKHYIKEHCFDNYGLIVDEFYVLVPGPGWKLLRKTDILSNESILRVNCQSAKERF